MRTYIIAVTNQKGGVGKTTTAIHLAHGLALHEPKLKVLLVDLDPQGNATEGTGVRLDSVKESIADVIRDKSFPINKAVYHGMGIDLIPATPLLACVERELVGITNGEFRLSRRLSELRGKYSAIIIDTPPTFGPLMNSALNAADELIVPIDSSYFAMKGVTKLLAEIEEIQQATNPRLSVLGYLLTLRDQTNISNQIFDSLISSFGADVFHTTIRRTTKFKEASALGRSIFQHSLDSNAALDYLKLAEEVIFKLKLREELEAEKLRPQTLLTVVEMGASHE